ncbi:MAG: hypothetical protein KAH95_12465 [Spirochaetales bacterium]|nr:hypothetical protein [Spirochaetales bacterium]
MLEEHKLSSAELVDYDLDRIQQIDKNGPSLNSPLELNPDAIKIAIVYEEISA